MKTISKDQHDKTQYSNCQDLAYWKEHNERHEGDSVFNNKEIKLIDLLESHKNVRKTAVDIGSGAGWLSSKLSSFFEKIISIEPSQKAVDISKKLYTDKPNIEWILGYAEDVLAVLEFNKKEPVLFVTCSVFQHLNNKDVEKVLSWLNENAPTDSILGFQEPWGEDNHREMHHVRTKEWWSSKLSNWNLDFHGPQVLPNTNKGFHGIKKV